jgi:hypothetical protein
MARIRNDFDVMEIIYEGMYEFGYGTLSRVSVWLFGIDDGPITHDH